LNCNGQTHKKKNIKRGQGGGGGVDFFIIYALKLDIKGLLLILYCLKKTKKAFQTA